MDGGCGMGDLNAIVVRSIVVVVVVVNVCSYMDPEPEKKEERKR